MKKLVFRDAEGRVINIGPWDYAMARVENNPVPADVRRVTLRDLNGGAVPDGERWYRQREGDGGEQVDGELVHEGPWDHRLADVSTNPLPPGATSREETVVVGHDGGLYAADDPRQHAA